MENIVRTVYGAALQTSELLNIPLTILPNSTLNQKLNIFEDQIIDPTDNPSVNYIAIGNGGHKWTMGTNNIPLLQPVQHTPRHSALYNQLPFVLRLPSNDLTANERSKYRLRKLVTYNDTQYVAYYLKVIDKTDTAVGLELRSVINEVTTSTPFIPTISDLNPTPPTLLPGQVLTTTGDYIAASAKIPFLMNANEINEFLNVANVIYNDEGYAMISEIAICSGVDKTLVGNFNGASIGYTDVICSQIVSHMNVFYAAKFTNDSMGFLLDVGSVEPLLNITQQ